MAFLDNIGVAHLWEHILARLSTKVEVEDGKGLSTNDYTDEDKNKLNSISNDYETKTDASAKLDDAKAYADIHINNKANPHGVTAEQVGAATVEYVDTLTKVYAQPDEPTNPKEGDIWFDTDEAVVSYAEGENF